MTLTVWTDASFNVVLAQLSELEADGTAQEQLELMAGLDAYTGLTCVDPNYTGTIPEGDPKGWKWNNGAIIAVTLVPASVTPRQVRLLLLSQNLLLTVEDIIAEADKATQITWEFASEFRRDDSLLLALAAQLNLTPEQVDQFFIAAAAI